MTGAAKGTVLELLAYLGAKCREYHYVTLRDLACQRVQGDELELLPREGEGRPGREARHLRLRRRVDLDGAYSKLVPFCWLVGTCDADSAFVFMQDLASGSTSCARNLG